MPQTVTECHRMLHNATPCRKVKISQKLPQTATVVPLPAGATGRISLQLELQASRTSHVYAYPSGSQVVAFGKGGILHLCFRKTPYLGANP